MNPNKIVWIYFLKKLIFGPVVLPWHNVPHKSYYLTQEAHYVTVGPLDQINLN